MTPSAPDRQAVLLSRDAAGMLRWHLPETTPAPAADHGSRRDQRADLSFRIPRERFAAAADGDRPPRMLKPDTSATSAEPATGPNQRRRRSLS